MILLVLECSHIAVYTGHQVQVKFTQPSFSCCHQCSQCPMLKVFDFVEHCSRSPQLEDYQALRNDKIKEDASLEEKPSVLCISMQRSSVLLSYIGRLFN